MQIIGDAKKKKHQKNLDDSRQSITCYRTSSAGGATGPTAFLMAGSRKKSGYDDAFLVRHGAACGSCIEMTPTAFMTDDAWENITPKLAKGIRDLPVICDHPEWWVIKIVDGYGSHCKNLVRMLI